MLILISDIVLFNYSVLYGQQFCENHDDGVTEAVVVCTICGLLCVECDRVLHLSKLKRSHHRNVFKEEQQAIKVNWYYFSPSFSNFKEENDFIVHLASLMNWNARLWLKSSYFSLKGEYNFLTSVSIGELLRLLLTEFIKKLSASKPLSLACRKTIYIYIYVFYSTLVKNFQGFCVWCIFMSYLSSRKDSASIQLLFFLTEFKCNFRIYFRNIFCQLSDLKCGHSPTNIINSFFFIYFENSWYF